MQSKGFTLIELLVVIAIVGILASFTISGVNSMRGKAANASIKTGLKSIIPAAQIIYDSTNSFSSVCVNANINRAYTAAGATGGGSGVCNNSSSAWAASAPLKVAEDSSIYWCVDSNGNSKGIASALGTARSCP